MSSSRKILFAFVWLVLATVYVETQQTGVCVQPIDLVFAFDASGSVENVGFEKIKSFAKEIVSGFQIGRDKTHVGVITFSEYAEVNIRLTDSFDQSDLTHRIDNIPYQGYRTATNDALRVANEMFSLPGGVRQGVPQVLIFLTDGKCTLCKEPVEGVVKPLHDKGVNIYSIGVTANINKTELEVISSKPASDHMFEVDTFDQLKSLVINLQTQGCKVKNGKCAKPTEPFLCNPKDENTCYGDQQCPGEQKCCNDGCVNKCRYPLLNCLTSIDIAFALDASNSVLLETFEKMKDFANEIVDSFAVSQQEARFASLTYSENANIDFNFVRYDSADEIKQAIKNLPHTRGNTRVDRALEIAKSDIFSLQGAVRTRRPMVLIVFFDGDVSRGMRDLAEVAEPLKTYGINVVAIGIGPEINDYQLNKIVSSPNSIFKGETFRDVLPELYAIAKEACNEKSGTCKADNTQVDPKTCLGVANECNNDFDCFGNAKCCKSGCEKMCVQPENVCKRKVDVAFALHQNLDENELQRAKDFIKSTVSHFDVGVNKTHTALLTFGARPKVEFDFNTGQDFRNKVIQQIDGVKYDRGTGRISDVLALACDAIFCAAGGTRNTVPKMLIIITSKTAPSPDDELNKRLGILRARGVDIIIIGIGDVDVKSLQPLTSLDKNVEDRVWLTKYAAGLLQYSRDVADFACGEAGTVFPPIGGIDGEETKESSCNQPKTCVKGPKGSMGRPGAVGPVGEPGVPGLVGPKGIPGSKGVKGPDGRTGAKGRRGPDGVQGLPGYPGYDGLPGQQGVEGRRGEDGDCGLPGKSGDAGVHGLDGFNGPPGYPGVAGLKGIKGLPALVDPNLKIEPGAKGDHGEQGKDGFKGPKGFEGTQGDRGDDGEEGNHGLDGEKGEMGDLGTYFHVKGPKGEAGERGKPGPSAKPLSGGNINGTEGLQGSKGPDGKKGQKGEVGDKGVDAVAQGLKGRQGPQGELGDSGETGREGPVGNPGAPGAKGISGEKGEPGDQGRPGMIGQPGKKGEYGERGPDGKKGATGDSGESVSGSKGTNGETGEQGLPGPQGVIGLPGPSGQKGIQGGIQIGSEGDPGPVGPRGLSGKNGMSGSPGMEGLRGPKGLKGDSGARGNPGRNAELRAGKPGMDGPPGEKGLRGPIGDVGKSGPPGENLVIKCAEPPCPKVQGKKGEVGSPGDTGLPGNDGYPGAVGPKGYPGGPCSTCPSGEQGTSGDVGETGKTGERGSVGLQGDRGDVGAQGIDGPEGPSGPKGEKGIQGPEGDIGPQGEVGKNAPGTTGGAKGTIGLPGDNGHDGQRGAQGTKGKKGIRGNVGPDGRRGKQGAKGEIGLTGEKGTDAFPGTMGENGDAGESMTGPPGLPGQAGRDGKQGEVGNIGAEGPKGEPGAAPTEEDLTNMKKNMKGNEGDRGSQGDVGLMGPKGQEGPEGKRGAKGERGPKGPKGENAPKGDIGPKGRVGPDGDPGEHGFPGKMGLTGEPGENGKPGAPGTTPKGEIGESGPKGPIGEKGPDAPPPPGCVNLDLTDIAFLIDNSRSVDKADFEKQKRFIKDILNQFTIGTLETQAGIIRYGNEADVSVYLNQYTTNESLEKAIDDIQYTAGSETRLDLALKRAQEDLFNTANGARTFVNNKKVNKALVILGDGYISGGGITSKRHYDNSIAYAKTLRDSDVTVYAVGVGPEINSALLEAFVSKPHYLLQIDSYKNLISTIGGLRAGLQDQCTIDGDPGRDGVKGDRGDDGDRGFKGQPGDGIPGPDGLKGQKGDDGVTYAEGGDRGKPGRKGEQGPEGRPGRPGQVILGLKGKQGEKGATTVGPKGPHGDEGVKGLKGDPGQDGKTLCDYVLATDIVFLMDSSNSVGPNNFDKMKSFIKNIIKKFDVDNQLTRVSVITFDEDASLKISFNQYHSLRTINDAIDNLPYMAGKATRMDKALIKAKQQAFTEERGARSGVQKVIVLMTDGFQSYATDQVSLSEAVQPLIDDKVLRYAIGIGQEISPEDLKTIAGRHVVMADNFDQLQLKIDDQIGLIGRGGCKGDPGTPGLDGKPGLDGSPGIEGPPGPRGPEGERGPDGIKGIKGVQGESRGAGSEGPRGDVGDPGPIGLPGCEQKERVSTDLGFMLDASGSLYAQGFEQEKKFIKAVIKEVGSVSQGGIHVGVVVYSDDAVLSIKFNDHYNQNDLENAIDKIPYAKKNTRIDLGLLEAQKMFRTIYGGRENSKKVLILLTDGQQSYVPGIQDPTDIARNLTIDGIDIFAVGIGQEIDKTELESFTSKPEHLFLAEDIQTLIKDLTADIAQALECPGGPRGPNGQPGDDGPPGDAGPVGKVGKPGPKGFPGDPGIGPKGDSGDIGIEGKRGGEGDKGFRGPDGPDGVRGPRGPPGYAGPPGLKGQRGLEGFVGLEGPKGRHGAKGEKGLSNDTARKGPPGDPGDEGERGPTGERGSLPPGNEIKDLEGDRGEQGPEGEIGARGPPGALKQQPGPSGNLGIAGDKGESGVFGDPGEIGPQGKPGEKGQRGDDGRHGLIGDDGDVGPAGIDGERGDVGTAGKRHKGEIGEPGLNGKDGKRGPDGESGLPGFVGMVGKKGELGEPGPKGRMRPAPLIPDPAMKGYKGSPGIDGDFGEKGQKGERTIVIGKQGERGDKGDEGPQGPQGPTGDQGIEGLQGAQGQKGQKGLIGADGNPGSVGVAGRKGRPGEIIGGGDRGDGGDVGYEGPKGRPGKKGAVGDNGARGPPGSRGVKGAPGRNGFPGLRGDQGPEGRLGPEGPIGKNGPQGEIGSIGPPGPPGHAEGFYIVKHSQSDKVPDCPLNYKKLWDGYSLMYTVGNGQSHSQDLGDAGSCSKSFSTLPFLFCSIVGTCKYASRNDFVYWLSGDVRQPMMPVSNNAIEPFISRCAVCEAPSVHIAVHSQDTLKPECPIGFDSLWDGYSFMMVAGAGKTGAGQSLSSSGSCLEDFRPKPFIECQGSRGTCHFFSDKFSFWLTTIDPARQFITQPSQTLSEAKNHDLRSRVSRCKVCIRKLKSDTGGNKPESNDAPGNQADSGFRSFFSRYF